MMYWGKYCLDKYFRFQCSKNVRVKAFQKYIFFLLNQIAKDTALHNRGKNAVVAPETEVKLQLFLLF